MKKNLIILLVTFFVGSTAYSQNAAGVYSTDFRQLTLVQSGNRVTGTYESGNGKLEGTLSGTRLTGTWTNSGSKKTGRFEFVFVSDFSSFTGKYGYNESTPSSRWNGTKTSSPTTVTAETKASIANISGVYTTDFKQLTLNQNGNEVTGTYENGNGKLRGTLSGNKFSGTWTNSASIRRGNLNLSLILISQPLRVNMVMIAVIRVRDGMALESNRRAPQWFLLQLKRICQLMLSDTGLHAD